MQNIQSTNYITENIVRFGDYFYHYSYSPLRLFGRSFNNHVIVDKIEKNEEQLRKYQLLYAYSSKKTLRDLILCNLPYGQPKFLTLTYATPQHNETQAKLDFKNFIKRLRYHTKCQLRYIAVPETHNSIDTRPDRLYSYHFHILIFDLSYISAKVYADIWRHGFIKINRVHDDHIRMSYYLSKYLTKTGEHKKYQRRFLTSRNVFRPVSISFVDLPLLEYQHTRRYTRFTGGNTRCDIYKLVQK